jgi:hypothetical protein
MKVVIKMKQLVTIFIVTLPLLICGQDFKGRLVLGEQHAKEEIKKAIEKIDEKTFYDTLINDKETVLAIVEAILFKIYGKKNIINQRPYECYLIDGYWFVSGT